MLVEQHGEVDTAVALPQVVRSDRLDRPDRAVVSRRLCGDASQPVLAHLGPSRQTSVDWRTPAGFRRAGLDTGLGWRRGADVVRNGAGGQACVADLDMGAPTVRVA
jgi:hypothetical protein